MRRTAERLVTLLLGLALAAARPAGSAPATRATAGASGPWLAISDIHYGPDIGGAATSKPGEDTNDALLDSFFAELRRTDPNPPVVFIGGDFLAHHFAGDKAAATMAGLARRFDALYPRAQFVITLGNNDSPCGDYEPSIGGPFLATVARAWAPLVDRNGAAPQFATTFARDGSYVATLPVPGLHAVVVNDVFLSLRTQNACDANQNGAAIMLAGLGHLLRTLPRGSSAWLLLHEPPGIDAFTTGVAQRFAVIPFLRPGARRDLELQIAARGGPVSLVIAGHTHKFAYRIVPGGRRVPMLLVPSVSPIFSNAPSYLELGVTPHGAIASVRERSLQGGAWRETGDLAALGVHRFDAPELAALQERLAREPKLRQAFALMYEGGAPPEIGSRNWPLYWCAATAFAVSEYSACTAAHHDPIRTFGALSTWGAVAVVAIVLLVALALAFASRRARGVGSLSK